MTRHPSLPSTWRRRARGLACAAGCALALVAGAAAAQELLPPERAFALSVRALDDHTLEARFNVADGYYLYRNKLRFSVEPASAGPLQADLPPGKLKHDEFFGDVETYRGLVVVKLPLARPGPGSKLVLATESQGCADVGVCYPPQLQKLAIGVPLAGAGASPIVEAGAGKLPAWLK